MSWMQKIYVDIVYFIICLPQNTILKFIKIYSRKHNIYIYRWEKWKQT